MGTPCQPADTFRQRPAETPVPLRGGTSAMPRDARILIVDGHDDTLYALESALAPLGRPLGRATTSEAALKQLLRGNVGLVLLNLRAPGTGGLDVVGYMRRLEQTQHIPVVLLTAHGRD